MTPIYLFSMEKITATFIFDEMHKLVEAKIPVAREAWLEIAFKLNILRVDEAKTFNKMRQAVATEKNKIYQLQEKKNVAAVDMKIESTDEYRFMKDQEDLIYSVDEMVRIAKKSSDINF